MEKLESTNRHSGGHTFSLTLAFAAECREISLRHFKFMETIASSITVIEIQKDREAR